MGFEAFFYFVWYSHDHSDGLCDMSPGFGYVSEYGCCMGGVCDDFSHPLQLIFVFSHGCEVCDDRLSLDHVVVFIPGAYDADFAWVSGFIFSDNDVPGCFGLIGVVDRRL